MNHLRAHTLLAAALCVNTLFAQSSDSAIVRILQEKNIAFTHNNKVVLLPSGKEKFEDMFKAIAQAKSSVHLEYFNFRNDSIEIGRASCRERV